VTVGTGNGARPAGDASAKPPQSRLAVAAAIALAAGWAALAVADGGIDPGEPVSGAGPTASFLALALGAPAAAAAAWSVARRGMLRPAPTRLALAAAAGLAVWSAASISWAAAPDLAWLEANRMALALCALLMGIALGGWVRPGGAALAAGLTLASVPVVAWALSVKVLPTVAGGDGDPGRLSEPLGYWNALGLLVVAAVPGAVAIAARTRGPAWVRGLSAAWIALLLVALLLTYSRGSLVALAVVVALVLWLAPGRARALRVLAAGAAGAVLPAVHGLTAPALTTDRLPAAARRDAGLGLGWRLLLGMAIAAAVLAAVDRLPARRPGRPRAARRAALAVAAALLIAAGGLAITRGGELAHWVGDRVSAGEDVRGVANDPGRLARADPNRRLEWWGEAARGFAGAPLAGNGAGSFPLVHLREREEAPSPREKVLDPHQIALRMASDLGVVGVALLAALVAAVWWGAARARRGGADPTVGYAIAIAAAFALHVQLDWTWSVPAVAVPAFVASGVVLAALRLPEARPARVLPTWSAGLLAALALAAAASAALPWLAQREVAAGYSGSAYAHAATARDLNPLSIEPDVLEVRAARARGDIPRALAAARRATRRQPASPRAWRLLAEAASGAGLPREARQARARVRELDPLGPPP